MSELILPPGPLISTDWLAAHLENPALRIVDVRGVVKPPTDPKPHYFASPDLYAQGHIPGAVFVDWTSDIVDLSDPVPVQVAPPTQYAELMGRLGIGDDTSVIAYDTTLPFFAARLLWTLRYYGHANVRVLDGGIKKWQAEGRPLETMIPRYTASHFIPRPQPALRRTVEEVLAALDGSGVLIDGRSVEEFHGEQSRAARGGHIPGARNVPYRDLVTGPHDTFAPPEQLRERFLNAGVDIEEARTQDVVVYCNGGVSALVTALGMELAGGPQAALYDGSWNEWGNRDDLPLER
ncbi:MAG: sulfurtransferase [Herpetosiphonaceae bacterium]|nr:sulfurtransferase [Herpetosiphonaceae bacterium]